MDSWVSSGALVVLVAVLSACGGGARSTGPQSDPPTTSEVGSEPTISLINDSASPIDSRPLAEGDLDRDQWFVDVCDLLAQQLSESEFQLATYTYWSRQDGSGLSIGDFQHELQSRCHEQVVEIMFQTPGYYPPEVLSSAVYADVTSCDGAGAGVRFENTNPVPIFFGGTVTFLRGTVVQAAGVFEIALHGGGIETLDVRAVSPGSGVTDCVVELIAPGVVLGYLPNRNRGSIDDTVGQPLPQTTDVTPDPEPVPAAPGPAEPTSDCEEYPDMCPLADDGSLGAEFRWCMAFSNNQFKFDALGECDSADPAASCGRLGEVVLQQGDGWCPEITHVQYLLSELGSSPIDIDGYFGPSTARAVAAFQSAQGIVVDAQVGPATWEAILVTADEHPAP